MADSNVVPPFHGNVSFNAQHSPMGAFMSFTCGNFNTRGGFGLEIGKPGNQNLYIGIKDGDRYADLPLKVLPFYEGSDAHEAQRYTQSKDATPSKLKPYAAKEIKRHYGWASDQWVTSDFTFTIYSPFRGISDPGEVTFHDDLRPSVIAELVVDNTNGKTPKTAFFAIDFADPGVRILDSGSFGGDPANGQSTFPGFAWKDKFGVAAEREGWQEEGIEDYKREPFVFCRFGLEQGLSDGRRHYLGTTPGIGIEVPPGKKRTLRLMLGGYIGGVATTRLEGRYFYTRGFRSLEHVLLDTRADFDNLKSESMWLDLQLLGKGLSPDQQFLVAHSTRSYYGSTQLLEIGGEPFWIVNEGEYCMMNTLDLSVDHVFWELKQNPWVVKNLLDNFVKHYSYVDQIKSVSGEVQEGGVSFCHDMGVHNNFSPKGHSSYELPELDRACFSYMTFEELCNWILIAASYVREADDSAWAKDNRHVLQAVGESLLNRTGDRGIVEFDSTRCGKRGAEITTYDSLDHSLAQTRNNLYMATKGWASLLAMQLLLEAAGCDEADVKEFSLQAYRASETICAQADDEGFIPAVFEEGVSSSRILPAIEPLVYPWFWKSDAIRQHTSLYKVLARHTELLLKDKFQRNFFPDGGLRLSSTSGNSWMSKIAIVQHVVKHILDTVLDHEVVDKLNKADAAHVKWLTTGESSYWACSDQIIDGVAKGSKYYPRIITTTLWMDKRDEIEDESDDETNEPGEETES
jgi:xylan 1,4-beta-xylosidase